MGKKLKIDTPKGKHQMYGPGGKKKKGSVKAGSYDKKSRKGYEDMLKKAGEI
jgi:hypothetical protein